MRRIRDSELQDRTRQRIMSTSITTRKPRPSTVQVWKLCQCNTSFKSAQTYWNQALQAESSDAGTQSVATMTSGWGTLLLGIGGVLAGVGATVYAFKRPRGLSSAVSNPSASTSTLMPSK